MPPHQVYNIYFQGLAYIPCHEQDLKVTTMNIKPKIFDGKHFHTFQMCAKDEHPI
jgi:hypothetical protein